MQSKSERGPAARVAHTLLGLMWCVWAVYAVLYYAAGNSGADPFAWMVLALLVHVVKWGVTAIHRSLNSD